jgi:hypothetical protein
MLELLEPYGTGSVDPLPIVARELGKLDAGGPKEGDLTMALRLSAAIRRTGLSLEETCDLLVLLRAGVLAAWDMDRRHEPTPLVTGDARRVVLHLATCIDDLLERVGRRHGVARGEVVETTLRRAS